MGIIYKITNLLNGKVYIGQTRTSLKQRMSKHYSQANREGVSGIDGAIRKYGKENFKVEIICWCSSEELDEKEKEFIALYDSYNNGYNLTIGGQQKTTFLNLNDEEIILKFHEVKNIKETAKYFNCCDKTITRILNENNVDTMQYNRIKALDNLKIGTEKSKKKIRLIELNKEFDSMIDCGLWLIENGYSKAGTPEQARKSISRVLNGQRQSYCGFHFEPT